MSETAKHRGRFAAIAGTAITVLVGWLLVGQPALASFSGRDGKFVLVVATKRSPHLEVWDSGALGQRPRKLLTMSRCASVGGVSFSPSGRQIAVQEWASNQDPRTCRTGSRRYVPPEADLVISNADGTAARVVARFAPGFSRSGRQVINDSLPGEFAWLPNGRTIVFGYDSFVPQPNGVKKLAFIDVKTGRIVRTVRLPNLAYVPGPVGAPDGQLLFAENPSSIEVLRADGSYLRTINVAFAGAASGDYIPEQDGDQPQISPSPDGSQIALTAQQDLAQPASIGHVGGEGTADDIFVVSATGGTARLLTRSRDAIDPVWSPDGKEIEYRDGTGYHVLTLADGRVRNVRFNGLNVVQLADWQPLIRP